MCARVLIVHATEAAERQVQRAGATALDVSEPSAAPAPLQPLVRPPRLVGPPRYGAAITVKRIEHSAAGQSASS